jgi:hypothetical protein
MAGDLRMMLGIPGYIYRSASEYYLTEIFTRGSTISTAEKFTTYLS